MTLSVQFLTLITMVVSGTVFGAVLDTYNYFLDRKNRKRWLVFIHDILFWIVQGLLIFYVLFRVNNGEVRFYIFVSLLCGFSAYQALFKNLYMKLLEMVIKTCLWTWGVITRVFQLLIISPIMLLIQFTKFVLILVQKVLLALLKVTIRLLKWIIRIIMSPIVWIFRTLWELLPKRIKNKVDKYYNTFAGFIEKNKKLITKVFNEWFSNNKNKEQ